MRVGVVGAGPVGVFCAGVLAQQGHQVLLLDRDPGPPAEGDWARQGVMQFLHPHFWRPQFRQVLSRHLPSAWEAVVAAGGEDALADGMPVEMRALACRRWVVETALRRWVRDVPGVEVRAGYVDDVVLEHGRVAGLLVDGARVDVDLVLDVSGRSGRLAESGRPPVEGGTCGMSYVSRMYRARPGAQAHKGYPLGEEHDGYLTFVFAQDDDTISALLVRPTDDERLAPMRTTEGFEVLARGVPLLARWTDPEQFEPITAALPGGGLTNTFRRQVDDEHPAVPGLLFVGDAVMTTNPSGGRGAALGLQQAEALLGMVTGPDTVDAAERFDAWCTEHQKPWYDDHVLSDATTLARWAAQDVDVDGPLSSDLIIRAGEVDASIMAVAGPYMGMVASWPDLQTQQEKARAVLRTGWRPQPVDGPTVDELAELLLREGVAGSPA